MLQLSNGTPFAAHLTLLPDVDGVDTVFTIVKGTFVIGPTLTPADEQLAIAHTDIFVGEPNASSVRIPCDVSLGKVGTDVVMRGNAWAPGGQPIWQMDVTLAAGPVARRARIFGDRVWESGGGIASMSWVSPFVCMPLVWERAFGGSDDTEQGPALFARNPVGRGYRAKGNASSAHGLALPNLEDPATPITSISDVPAPAGFAPVPPHWEPRRSYAGTYDQEWERRRAPFLPADFDRRFLQMAPPGLVAPRFLQPGEWVSAEGVTQAGRLQFPLPPIRIEVTYILDNDAFRVATDLDAIILEPDEMRVVLVWRAALRCDKKARRVREARVAAIGAA